MKERQFRKEWNIEKLSLKFEKYDEQRKRQQSA